MTRWRAARASFALGLVALALAIVALVPRFAGGARTLEVALVDVSASSLALRPSWGAWIEGELDAWRERARERGAQIAVVAFGRDVRRTFGPASALALEPRWSTLVEPRAPAGALASRLALAFETALALEPARVTLFSDGTFTGADPAAIARALPAPIDLVAPGPVERANARIERWSAPSFVERGARVAATLDVAFEGLDLVAAPRAFARVSGGALGSTRVALRTAPIDLASATAPDARGVCHAVVHVDLAPFEGGAVELEARVELLDLVDGATGATADGFAADDARSAVIGVRGGVSVAVIGEPAGRDGLARALSEASNAAGLTVFSAAASDLGPSIARAGVLVLVDVPDRDLPQGLVETFVRAGGGLVDLAGPRWLASPRRTSLAALAPTASGDDPRAALFLVDASGSMAGAAFDEVRAALAQLADVAPAGVALELATFAGEIGERRIVRAAGARDSESGADVAAIAELPEPRGPTRLVAALETLARTSELARGTLVVVVSDGRDAEREGGLARAREVRAALASQGVEVRAIAASQAPDLELLAALAGGGERVSRAGALDRRGARDTLVRLFERELSRGAWLAGGDAGIALQRASGTDLPSGLELVEPPRVERLLRARAGEGASAVWHAPSGEVALALRRVGAGAVLGAAWAAGAAEAPLVGALARFAGRTSDERELSATVEDGAIVVRADALKLPAIVRAELAIDGETATLELVAGAGGRDPLREHAAAVPEGAVERASGRVAILRGRDGSGNDFALPLALPEAPELETPLRTFLPPPSVAASSGARAAHPLAPWALALALAALSIAGFLAFVARR